MTLLLTSMERAGDFVLGALAFWGNTLSMAGRSFHSAVVVRWHSLSATLRVVAAQVTFTGVQAMPLVFLLAAVTGSVIVFYAGSGTNPMSGGDVGMTLLYLLVGRELGPLITGLVVIARSGSAVASELGNMRANGETDALQAMAIDPLSFIVFPRMLAGIVSMVCLIVYFDVIAFLGAFTAAHWLHNVPFSAFVRGLVQLTELEDVIVIAVKSLLMGLVIFSVSTYQGLQVKKSHHEVPQVTTKAVVVNILTVTLLNFVLSGIVLWRHLQGTHL